MDKCSSYFTVLIFLLFVLLSVQQGRQSLQALRGRYSKTIHLEKHNRQPNKSYNLPLNGLEGNHHYKKKREEVKKTKLL